MIKTTLFLIVFWSVFLFAIPIGISIVEIELGLQRFPSFTTASTVLLLLSTGLVLWAALTLAVKGGGTPLPLVPPRHFVVTGPYAYLRHPFVAGAIGQIVALGIGLGSAPVLGYAVVALVVWYYVFRPREERGLDRRFGARVEDYRRRVRGFRPF